MPARAGRARLRGHDPVAGPVVTRLAPYRAAPVIVAIALVMLASDPGGVVLVPEITG